MAAIVKGLITRAERQVGQTGAVPDELAARRVRDRHGPAEHRRPHVGQGVRQQSARRQHEPVEDFIPHPRIDQGRRRAEHMLDAAGGIRFHRKRRPARTIDSIRGDEGRPDEASSRPDAGPGHDASAQHEGLRHLDSIWTVDVQISCVRLVSRLGKRPKVGDAIEIGKIGVRKRAPDNADSIRKNSRTRYI